jgi:hypothetical protein
VAGHIFRPASIFHALDYQTNRKNQYKNRKNELKAPTPVLKFQAFEVKTFEFVSDLGFRASDFIALRFSFVPRSSLFITRIAYRASSIQHRLSADLSGVAKSKSEASARAEASIIEPQLTNHHSPVTSIVHPNNSLIFR